MTGSSRASNGKGTCEVQHPGDPPVIHVAWCTRGVRAAPPAAARGAARGAVPETEPETGPARGVVPAE
eukprot:7984142-Pyramimonas_sp.AAC.1